ncbi:hypothetical protein E2C01_097621 [Portunus trituberculatus]|uniref:Uncharacterized protein n=1 Tax=Portunus trituberculatus TaxID=210409 RepID=A0A5B7K5B9_PORTR|nr:hypothetical protein [Portunus trituberculatus]
MTHRKGAANSEGSFFSAPAVFPAFGHFVLRAPHYAGSLVSSSPSLVSCAVRCAAGVVVTVVLVVMVVVV